MVMSNKIADTSQRLECLPRTIKERKIDTILQEMYSDTLDMDISFDVPVRRLDMKGLI